MSIAFRVFANGLSQGVYPGATANEAIVTCLHDAGCSRVSLGSDGDIALGETYRIDLDDWSAEELRAATAEEIAVHVLEGIDDDCRYNGNDGSSWESARHAIDVYCYIGSAMQTDNLEALTDEALRAAEPIVQRHLDKLRAAARADFDAAVARAAAAAFEEDRLMVVGLHSSLGWVYRDKEDFGAIEQLSHTRTVASHGLVAA